MALQRGGDYDAVRRVALDAHQETGSGCDASIDGNLGEAPIQKVASPSVQGDRQVESALLDQHADFPEGYRGGGGFTFLQSLREHAARSRTQPPVAALVPQQDVSVEQNQIRSSPSGLSNQSAGMGETISPRIRILSRWRPNGNFGFSV